MPKEDCWMQHYRLEDDVNMHISNLAVVSDPRSLPFEEESTDLGVPHLHPHESVYSYYDGVCMLLHE